MLKIIVDPDFKPLENIANILASEQVFQAAAQQAYENTKDDTLNILQKEPAVRVWEGDYPIEWTSPAQARFVKAVVLKKDSQGNLIPYKRNHKLSQGWEYEWEPASVGVVFFYRNPAPSAKYVYGTLNKSIDKAREFQQQFHAITGWPLIIEEVLVLIDVLIAEFKIALNDQMKLEA